VIEDADLAQARVLIIAMREQIADLTTRLAKVEAQTRPGHTHRDLAMRREANALRRDIAHAQRLIDRLQRRYPRVSEASA